MPDTGPSPEFLKGLYEALRGRAAGLAPHFQPGYDSAELDGADVETLWHRRSMPLEAEWALHRARNPDGTPTYTREQIGLMVFKDREKLAKSGGRVEPKEWIAWTNSTARRMEKKRAARETSEAPTPPAEGEV